MPARRGLLALPLLAALLAGCATTPSPVGDADAAHAGVQCPAGSVVTGFNAAGSPLCDVAGTLPSPLAGFSCPEGQFVKGFDSSGKPRCAAPSFATAVATPTPTYQVSSNLKALNVYGVRNTTAQDLWDLKVNLELSAGAVPMDLSKLVVRFSDGTQARNYVHDARPLADAGAPSASFAATWIRGNGDRFVMESGDLVQIHFNLVGSTLAPRTSAELTLIPEVGSAVAADFKTPATYGGDTIITLR